MIIYSTSLNTQAKVIAIYGGTTWVQVGAGRTLISAGTGYTVKATGGNKDAIIPYHRHSVAKGSGTITGGSHNHPAQNSTDSFLNMPTDKTGIQRTNMNKGATGTEVKMVMYSVDSPVTRYSTTGSRSHTHDMPAHNTDYVGASGNLTNANMQPYYVVYIWERTA